MIKQASKPKQRPIDERLKIKDMEGFFNQIPHGDEDIPFIREKLQEAKKNPECDLTILERLIRVKAGV